MSVLIITYDIGSSGKDYTPFFEAIKKHSDRWARYITDTWFVKTELAPNEFFDLIHPYLDQRDFLFVAEIEGKYWGYLPAEAWNWFKEQGVL